MIVDQLQSYLNKDHTKIIDDITGNEIAIIGWFKVYNLSFVQASNIGFIVGLFYNFYYQNAEDKLFKFRIFNSFGAFLELISPDTTTLTY
jgi:hypothetical protein